MSTAEGAQAPNNFICHRIAGGFHWELKLHGISVDDAEISLEETPLMLMDTGTTLIYLPQRDWEKLIEKVCEGLECVNPELIDEEGVVTTW